MAKFLHLILTKALYSLSATFLRNRIIAALRDSRNKSVQATATQLSQDFVFQYPTLDRLSKAIVALVNPELKDILSMSLTDEIQAMINKYSADFPVFKIYHPPTAGIVVLLTGSTGALGCHILATLLSNDSVVEVITVNRGYNVAERQRAAFESRGIPTDMLSSNKLTSLAGQMKEANLGLNDTKLSHVCASQLSCRSPNCVGLSMFDRFVLV